MYVIIDNGQDYSDHSVTIHETSLPLEDVKRILALWKVARCRDGAFIVAFASDLQAADGTTYVAGKLNKEWRLSEWYGFFEGDIEETKAAVAIDAILLMDTE